ncbi:TIGR00730 family Rossman fold protein [Sandaracinobacteroides saxicola]|uniref:Cytokinin riboside 5'-monophosphate phosphoribohydrolase n=2 Tax=Sandaracinobacteroides saxicola TaxID=2759707 RepID=A0A7G5IMB9_9SPHN|nr:TIGR00730 family Rossman fold protein [Sandaracinobacteroides saxicola]
MHPLDRPDDATQTPDIRSLLVFCGSRDGTDPRHRALAETVGTLLATRGVRLIYGAGSLGLMGVLGRATLAAGGAVTGIIPRFLVDWEVCLPGLTETIVVDTLHARKALMFDAADAVLCLPGGHGTLDELAEILSWRNLRLHAKPVWLLGDDGFWAPFTALIDHLVSSGFSGSATAGHFETLPDVSALAARLPLR